MKTFPAAPKIRRLGINQDCFHRYQPDTDKDHFPSREGAGGVYEHMISNMKKLSRMQGESEGVGDRNVCVQISRVQVTQHAGAGASTCTRSEVFSAQYA